MSQIGRFPHTSAQDWAGVTPRPNRSPQRRVGTGAQQGASEKHQTVTLPESALSPFVGDQFPGDF